MSSGIVFLLGFLLGGLIVRFLTIMAARRALHPYEFDAQHLPATRAIMRHLKLHGTINLVQVEQMLSVNGVLGTRYLEQLEHEGVLRRQGHEGRGAFYTLV